MSRLLALLLAVAATAAGEATPTTVALLPWSNQNPLRESEWLCETGPELLALSMAQQPHLVLLVRRPEEMRREREVGSTVGAGAAQIALGGTFHREGDELVIELNAGERWSGNARGPAASYARLVADLAGRFSIAIAQGRSVPPVRTPSAPSLAIAALLDRARAALARGDAAAALPDLLRAVRGAPGSGPAWTDLASALDALGLAAAAGEARGNAALCGGDDPLAAERLRVLAEGMVKRDPRAARQLFQRLGRDYPYAERVWSEGWNRKAEPMSAYAERWLQTLPQERK